MIAEILKYKEFRKVTYYVLKVEGRKNHEFNDFIIRMNAIERFKPEVGKILQFIKDVGDKHGALRKLFRHERLAEALPEPKYHYLEVNEEGITEYGLRLYCLRLTEQVVLLLNGDIKTTTEASECINCGKHFNFANLVANKINKDIEDGTLSIYGKEIEIDDDYVLYL